MSKVWIFVEWIFGDVINLFKFLDYKKNFKIGLSIIGKMYVVCVIICNVLICMYGNQILIFFGLDLLLVYDYFFQIVYFFFSMKDIIWLFGIIVIILSVEIIIL